MNQDDSRERQVVGLINKMNIFGAMNFYSSFVGWEFGDGNIVFLIDFQSLFPLIRSRR
jgi:hypothetical protein